MECSKAINMQEIKSEAKKLLRDDGFILAYFYDKVLFGTYQNGELWFDAPINEGYLSELHIFNLNEELRAVKSEAKGAFIVRYRCDSDNGESYFDEGQYLIDGLRLPKDVPDRKAKLTVRSYLGYNKDNQLFVEDYRIVGFEEE